MNMQKLEKKKLITQDTEKEETEDFEKTGKEKRAKEKANKEKTSIRLTAEGEKICRDFEQVEADLRAVCTAGFSEEECRRFDDLKERMETNMIRFMVKEVWEEEQG